MKSAFNVNFISKTN